MLKMTANYGSHYNRAFANKARVIKALAERPSHAVKLADDAGGREAVQALFDAVLDQGHRQVLVQALNSPALPQWVREMLETLLYGARRRSLAALLVDQLH